MFRLGLCDNYHIEIAEISQDFSPSMSQIIIGCDKKIGICVENQSACDVRENRTSKKIERCTQEKKRNVTFSDDGVKRKVWRREIVENVKEARVKPAQFDKSPPTTAEYIVKERVLQSKLPKATLQ